MNWRSFTCMRRPFAIALVIAVLAAHPASAAAPIRLVESFTTPDFDSRQVLKVTAVSPEQRKDPNFNVMASFLGDALGKAGLNMQQDAPRPDAYILLDYKAYAIPFFRRFESPVSDPSYRALVVTAVDAAAWNDGHRLNILWQVVVDQTGISNDAGKTIPPLLDAAARYYGRNLTPKGLNAAASCASSNATTTGSHISGVCDAALTPLAAGLGFAAYGGGGGLTGAAR